MKYLFQAAWEAIKEFDFALQKHRCPKQWFQSNLEHASSANCFQLTHGIRLNDFKKCPELMSNYVPNSYYIEITPQKYRIWSSCLIILPYTSNNDLLIDMTNVIINALRRQRNEELKYLLSLATVRRTKQSELQEALNTRLIKIITGPRRAGKSTLAIQALRDKSFAYANFEDEALSKSGDEIIDALEEIYNKPTYYLFDEIQSFPEWEIFVNKLHRRGKNLIITGSNSKLLSSELSSSLTGRHQQIELLPFNFTEFISCRYSTDSAVHQSASFEEWMKTGGYPEVILAEKQSTKYLRDLFDAVILRDVVGRYQIRNVAAVQALATLLINSVGSGFTARSIERSLADAAFSTLQRYITYFTEAYLFFELQAFSFKARKRIKSERKVYTIDNGFLFAKAQNILGGESRALENLVFIELLRRGYVPNLNLFYARGKNGKEVDFFLPNFPLAATAIQVCYSMAISSTRLRELQALVQVGIEFRATKLYILTMNEEAVEEIDGHRIQIMPAWRWCLENSEI